MTQDAQEMMDLMRGPVIRVITRKIKEENKGKAYKFERNC